MPTSDASGPGQAPALHIHQQGHGPRLILAHGFTQTGAVWGGLDGLLATSRTVVAVELPGHGGSAAVRVDLPTGAVLLGAACGAGDYLGYSMGARFCLHLALARPDLVRRLVLISGTAGIEDAGERAERRATDEALADRIDPAVGTSTDTIPEFVTRWVANPMFGTVPPAAQGLGERLTNTPYGLASSLRLAGTGTQEPLWDRLGELTMPVLVVTGANDAKFTDLGRRMVESIGANATHVVIADADHAPHLQRPGVVAAAVQSFLDAPIPD